MNQAHDFKRQAEIETVYVTEAEDFNDLVGGSQKPRIAFYAEPLEGEAIRKALADGCELDESDALTVVAGAPALHPFQGWYTARPSDLTLGHPELRRTALELACFIDSVDPNQLRFGAEFERVASIPVGLLSFEEERTKLGWGLTVRIGKMFLCGGYGRSKAEAYEETLRLLLPRMTR